MKPISQDLRRRIVDAYKRGKGTEKQLAARFSVSQPSVERYVRLDRETGSVAAKANPAGKARAKVKPSDRQMIEQWLIEDPDLAHAQLAERFSKERQCYVGRSKMGFSLIRLGITRKKSRSMSSATKPSEWSAMNSNNGPRR